MDSISDQLKGWKDGAFQKRLQKKEAELLASERIQKLINDDSIITEEIVKKHLNEFDQYNKERNHCDHCPGLEDCPNMMQGYQPVVSSDFGDIRIGYQPCVLKRQDDQKHQQQNMIKSLYIPKEIVEATFSNVDEDDTSKLRAKAKALEFAHTADPGNDGQGLYFYGKFGVGKTYMMGAIANLLAERDIETMLVYTPDFFREIKQGISDGSYQEKLEAVKSVPVLILDDIGAENLSSWLRDEVLGSLLQYRMMEKLPTLFTSNYDFDELEAHLMYTQKGNVERVEELKAKRIMERIRYNHEPIYLNGENRRKNN
ncbi:primosomal protein DnaI [Texcoconibacillus texcoconensis]|uniref:Primosomal protein DnaI n=1 Tax=Texcoconibacillus texcoconensis TaxID=1095777 RepID=A0A840QMW2_9BACI|nr:primosomal protein DnaI [Texcoconibacillus texcoconensis]MBB5172707.1 primosomal protein DnaI [Texcoconibacillus texcoconensis]